MDKYIKLVVEYRNLIAALILAAFLRFIWLDRVSPAIGGDELNYIFTAKYMALRWSDLEGTWNPLSIFLFKYPHNDLQAEISYYLLLPIVKFLPLTVFNIKIVFALISTFSVLPIYGIAKELFGKKTAVITSFLFAINPWEIFIGRTAYEMVPETFFYLLLIYLILKLKGNKIYFVIPVMLLAFYSHIATKIVLFPIIVLVLMFSYFNNNRKFIKQYIAIALFAFLLTIFFIVTIKFDPAFSRTTEIININDPGVADIVNHLRKATIENNLSYLFTNKISVIINILITKFAKTVSLDYLFVSGDQFYSLYTHGFFYLIDSLFIILGMFFIAVRNKKKFYLLLILSFCAIFPHLIHTIKTDNFVPQITLLFPLLLLFCGYGIFNILKIVKKKIALVFIIVIYLISFLNFANIYFYQYPLKETFDFKVRVLSKYLSFINNTDNVNIYSSNSLQYFKKYLFYGDLIKNNNADQISLLFKNKDYTIENVKFNNCNNFDVKKEISVVDDNCKKTTKNLNYLKIARLVDGGANFRIYNDNVCKNYKLSKYATNIKLSDFSVEKLTREEFCKVFITK